MKRNDSAGYGPSGTHTFSTYNDRLVQLLDGSDLLPVRVRDVRSAPLTAGRLLALPAVTGRRRGGGREHGQGR